MSEQRLLLIEDSALLRERLTALLTVPGLMQVAASADTEGAAVAHIHAGHFDVMIVDVELREGSGINVIRAARGLLGDRPRPLIIVLTNYSLPAVRERCMAAGADYFLDKMEQFSELRPLIESAARRQPH